MQAVQHQARYHCHRGPNLISLGRIIRPKLQHPCLQIMASSLASMKLLARGHLQGVQLSQPFMPHVTT